MLEQRRRWFFGLFNSRKQLIYGLVNIFVSLLLILIINSVSLYKFSELSQICSGLGGQVNSDAILSYLNYMRYASAIGVILTSGICFFFIVVMTHRFFGPLVPIIAHIERLKQGQFDSRVNLRPKDELHELSLSLNELAEELEKKYARN